MLSSIAAKKKSKYGDCTDLNPSCRTWAKDAECRANPGFMLKECRASCAVCESDGCHDNHAECVDWATAGECDKNRNYMFQECKFSCDVCHVNFKAECKRDGGMWP